jgi:EmrB/QacA subfamily drug resistance transporter
MARVTTAAAPSGAPAVAPDSRRWAVLGVMCLALLIVGIDGTIVNVALPSFVRELGTTSTQLQWIEDGYTMVFAGFLLIAGNTGDRLGRKPCLIAGLLVFGAGSFACSQVHSPNALILMRGVQGFGAAFIMPATLSILTSVFTDAAERGRAIAIWAGVSGLGVAIGPLAGGFLLQHFWWGSVFLVNVPVVALAVLATVAMVPNSAEAGSPPLDMVGTVLWTTGLVALLYGIIQGPADGWGDPPIIGAFVAAAVLLTGFVLWERRVAAPILDISFFANPRFTAASVAVTLVFFAMFGSLFFVSQFLQFVLGYSPLKSGAALLPVAGVLMVAAPASAKLVARFGSKAVVAGGLVLVSLALLLFGGISADSGYGFIAVVLCIIGVGMGFAMAPATDSIMGSLPPKKAGVGSAMNDTTREVGGALGVAVMGSVTTALYGDRLASSATFDQVATANAAAGEAARESVGAAAMVAGKLPAATAQAFTDAANRAFVHALSVSVIVAAGVALAGALVALLWLPARPENLAEPELTALIDGAAQRLATPVRRNLATATLGLLADAGMSSITYNGVAARSGVATTTLQRYWTSRVDAVTDAMREVVEAHPIPDTGDLKRDLRHYLTDLGETVSSPRGRQVIGALVAEVSRNPELEAAFRERVTGPRRAALESRLRRDADRLAVPIEHAVDQLIGPVYFRSLIAAIPADERFVDSVLATLIRPAHHARP